MTGVQTFKDASFNIPAENRSISQVHINTFSKHAVVGHMYFMEMLHYVVGPCS
jgi:hypothetical protein